MDVGLDYLTLDRSAATLSGGEAQRIRLATQIGSQLVGVLYILDEPSIGLHPRDNNRLLNSLKKLRDLGNSIVVVEHDQETMESADQIIDLGPGAGEHGGQVVYAGTPKNILKSKSSITGQYLSGKKAIPLPKFRQRGNGKVLTVTGARGNNLKEIEVSFPLGKLVVVTGVSGSGKSTLVNETVFPILSKELNNARAYPLPYEGSKGMEYLDKVIEIDQKPIGRTPRSNPATYTGVFTFIRDLFAQLPESKIRGYKPGRFKHLDEAIKNSKEIYLESYTVEFPYILKNLEKSVGRKIIPLEREKTESEFIVQKAKKENIVLLVYGCPLFATTHISLVQDCKKNKTKYLRDPRKTHNSIIKLAGLEYKCIHFLRHSWATNSYEATGDSLAVQELGGWEDPKSVSKYIKVSDEVKRKRIKQIATHRSHVA